VNSRCGSRFKFAHIKLVAFFSEDAIERHSALWWYKTSHRRNPLLGLEISVLETIIQLYGIPSGTPPLLLASLAFLFPIDER